MATDNSQKKGAYPLLSSNSPYSHIPLSDLDRSVRIVSKKFDLTNYVPSCCNGSCSENCEFWQTVSWADEKNGHSGMIRTKRGVLVYGEIEDRIQGALNGSHTRATFRCSELNSNGQELPDEYLLIPEEIFIDLAKKIGDY